MREIGAGVWIDEEDHIHIECMLCDAIVQDVVGHLRREHAGNPVAERLIKEIEKVSGSSDA
jgi:hypothetical protein